MQQTPDPPAIVQPFTYTGREWDAAPGLYYYRARYYDPSFGRFLSEDPIGFDGDPNLYVYVQNNPINLTDPFGFFSIDPSCKCEGFGEEAVKRAEEIAREAVNRITESGIRECIRRKINDGKVKCGSKKCDRGSVPDAQGRVLFGHSVPFGSTITLCKATFVDDKQIACTIIHEFAHTCRAREGRARRVTRQAISGCIE